MSRTEEPEAQHRSSSWVTGTPLDRHAKLRPRLVVIGVVLLVAVLAVQQLRARGPDVTGPPSVADYQARTTVENEPAPAFELPALRGGGTIGLDDFPEQVVVLNFWASWCAPCREEAPHLQATWEAYRGRGVQFLGVDYLDNRAAARAFLGEFGISYPSVFDTGELAVDYGLVGLPTTFVITPERRIAYRFVGKVDGAILRDALDDVLVRSG